MCDLTKFLPSMITAGATIITGTTVALVGFFAFYRQKEYELCKHRYLEEGFDVVVSTAQNALSVYNHNWARIIQVLKLFRDTPTDDFDIAELERGFIDLSENRFPLIAHYRVSSIIKSDIIWKVFQLVISFVQRGISLTKDEIPQTLRIKITTDKINSTKEELVDHMISEVQKIQEESYFYYEFLAESQKIIDLLETQKFSFKQVKEISNNSIVVKTISSLQEKFKDKLGNHSTSIASIPDKSI